MSDEKVAATFHPGTGPDAGAVNRAELARLDWTACPECDQGKHGNCDGTAWDVEADALTTCPCAEAGHPPTP